MGSDLAGFSDCSDVRVQVGGMWVELHEEHADMVQQWLASVCVLDGGQLPQVTELKATGLCREHHTFQMDMRSAGPRPAKVGH